MIIRIRTVAARNEARTLASRKCLGARRSAPKKSEARNSGWSEEDSEVYAQDLDPDTTLEDIKGALKDEPYFEEHPYEIEEVAAEIFSCIPRDAKKG